MLTHNPTHGLERCHNFILPFHYYQGRDDCFILKEWTNHVRYPKTRYVLLSDGVHLTSPLFQYTTIIYCIAKHKNSQFGCLGDNAMTMSKN
ncbi:hypothetical protein SLEP1_g35972 [Rubroshorea leprosula]|uniref:Uncharacterized protein n=1 Tax=Rubroshorea leprosula TaxID=152421 RepID=A0AAV5KQ35_9ROSI|nr:hypothetical protein SLEP1_g35972 [Rubroshorea leprosula]